MTSGIVSAAQRALVAAVLAGSLAACAAGPRSAADCGRHYVGGGSKLLGLLAAAGAFDRPAGPACQQPAFARGSAPQILEEEEESSWSRSGVAAPNFGDGQTVYSQHECIGAVVMGVCHGSILPDYSSPHPTCYGQMLNGTCTGPMF
jgi:hypothetical protein